MSTSGALKNVGMPEYRGAGLVVLTVVDIARPDTREMWEDMALIVLGRATCRVRHDVVNTLAVLSPPIP